MAKLEFGKGLKEKLQGAVDAAKEVKVSDVKDKLDGVKDSILNAADAAVDSAKDLSVSDVKEKLSGLKDSFRRQETEDAGEENSNVLEIQGITARNAIKIIYYLMAADGEIFHNEEEKFDAIGRELDPRFAEHREEIIRECRSQMDKVLDPEDYYDVLQDGVEDALIGSRNAEGAVITPKHLIWDLLTVAYSDEEYDEVERKLIKYILRKTNVDKTVFLEMESSLRTVMDIEKELAWIKTTDRPYLTIEAMVNELADRKSVILESIRDLIML